MKHITHTVALETLTPTTDGTAVKRCALSAFRRLRAAVEEVKNVPGLLAQAASDVQQAWEESASPKQ